jgi:hypothetical protein
MTSPPAVEPLNSNRLPASHLEVCLLVSSAYLLAQEPLLCPKLQRLAMSGHGGFGSLTNGAMNLRSRLSSAAVHGALCAHKIQPYSQLCQFMHLTKSSKENGNVMCLRTCPPGRPSAGRSGPASPCQGPWEAPLQTE